MSTKDGRFYIQFTSEEYETVKAGWDRYNATYPIAVSLNDYLRALVLGKIRIDDGVEDEHED